MEEKTSVYESLLRRPFERPHSCVERLFQACGLNRIFLRNGKHPHIRTDREMLLSPTESKLVEVQTLRSSAAIKGKETIGRTEWYSFEEIVHDTGRREDFEDGCGYNFYLSPLNLHYVLFPADMKINDIRYYPAFCRPIVFMKSGEIRNERLVIYAESEHGFPLIVILIGSFLVSGIECVAEKGKSYKKGELLGAFKLGSTVMLLFPSKTVEPAASPGDRLLLGEPFARFCSC